MEIFQIAIVPRIVSAFKQPPEDKAVVRVGLPIEANHGVVPSVLIRKITGLTWLAEKIPGCTDQRPYNRAVRGIQRCRQICSEGRA